MPSPLPYRRSLLSPKALSSLWGIIAGSKAQSFVLPQAKELRRIADEMVTLAKKNTLHTRRQSASVLTEPVHSTPIADCTPPRCRFPDVYDTLVAT